MQWYTDEPLPICQAFFPQLSLLPSKGSLNKKKNAVAFHHAALKVRGERHR